MRHKNLDLFVVILIALVNMLWILLPSFPPIMRTIVVFPLVFVVPGYALAEVLSYKRYLKTSHRLVFSLGLSLTLAILCGLMLNTLPAGFQASSWALLLGLLTVTFSLLAVYLRRYRAANETQPLKFRITIFQGLLLFLAVVVLSVSFFYNAVGAARQPHPGFTQLWVLPSTQTGKSCSVRFGLRSFETTPVTYRVAMTMNRAPTTTWSPVVLAPQEEWNRSESIVAKSVAAISVELQLYRLDKPQTVYRDVKVTFLKGQCDSKQSYSTRNSAPA